MSQPITEPTATPAAPANPAPAAPPAVPAPPAAGPNPEKADQPLQAPGLKALQAERERADKAEAALKSFEPYKGVLDGLQKLFTPEADQPKPEDVIAQITKRLDAADKKASVNELARKHGITSDDDIALLDAVTDPQQREALAARLKSAAVAIPPDPGQGNHQPPQNPADAEYEQYFPPTRK